MLGWEARLELAWTIPLTLEVVSSLLSVDDGLAFLQQNNNRKQAEMWKTTALFRHILSLCTV